MAHNLTPFEEDRIRKTWYNDQWYFSVLDIVEALTDTVNATDYFKKMRKRDDGLKIYVGTNCPYVEMRGKEGKKRKTIAANTEGVLRIIMSIPSTKAEPLKQWMAQVSKERIEETENPELMTERQAEFYKAKGYTDEWIERRLQTIEIRKQLTDEWQKRGVQKGQEYSILTAIISKGTFGLTPTQYTEHKELIKENLRDHMTPLELIFTALGEELTRSETVRQDAQGFEDNREAAVMGGKRAGDARRAVEKTGEQVISKKNYLKQIKEHTDPQKLDKPDTSEDK